MPKYDYDAVNRATVATVDETAHGRTATQTWLAVDANVESLLEVVASGLSLRRFCADRGLAYSPLQRFLTSEDMEPRYREAQLQQAEHLIGEMERITKAIEGVPLTDPNTGAIVLDKHGEPVIVRMDPKAGSVILDNLQWRISKFNQRRFGDRQVIEQHTYDHTRAHIEAVRQLARQPRSPLLPDTRRPAMTFEGELVRSGVHPAAIASNLPEDRIVEWHNGRDGQLRTARTIADPAPAPARIP